jgi:hypothetical protein
MTAYSVGASRVVAQYVAVSLLSTVLGLLYEPDAQRIAIPCSLVCLYRRDDHKHQIEYPLFVGAAREPPSCHSIGEGNQVLFFIFDSPLGHN